MSNENKPYEVRLVFGRTPDGNISVRLEGHDPSINGKPLAEHPIEEYWARCALMLCSRMIQIFQGAPLAPTNAGETPTPWVGPPTK